MGRFLIRNFSFSYKKLGRPTGRNILLRLEIGWFLPGGTENAARKSSPYWGDGS